MHPVPDFKRGRQVAAVRILLLEDDQVFAELVRANLARADWGDLSIEWVSKLADALARLEGGGFDLVITDLNLPDSKGLDTVESLVRATDRLILVLTGERDQGLREAAIGQGAYDLMSKDRIDRTELERLVRLAAMQANTYRSLHEIGERFRSLTELSSDWYWEQDSDFRITFMSKQLESKTGLNASAYIGRKRWEQPALNLTEADWDRHRAQLQRHEPFRNFEMHRKSEDGRGVWLSISGEPVFDRNGVFGGYRGVGSDITARKHAEHDLCKSEERFRSLAELSSDWYWEQDADLRFVATGGATDARGGITPEANVGKCRWELPSTEILNQTWDEHKSVLKARQPFHDLMLRRLAPTGEAHYISVSGRPIFDGQGAFCGYRGAAKDVTRRVRMDLRLAIEHSVTRLLAESNSIAEATPQIIRVVCETLGWACGARREHDERNQVMLCAETWGVASAGIEAFLEAMRRPAPSAQPGGLIRRAWAEGKPMWIPDVTQEPTFRRAPDAAKAGLHSAFAFPIKVGAQVIGVMEFFSREIHQPDAELLDCMTYVGSQIGQFMQRKRAEEEQLRFRVSIDASADFILLVDPASMLYVDANKTACRGLGYSREELLAMGPHDLFSVSREDLSQLYARLIAGDLSAADAEGWYRRKDGSRLFVESFRRAVLSAKGYVIVVVARDIGERRRAEQLLKLEHTVTRALAEAESATIALKAVLQRVCEAENWECGMYWRVDETAGVARFSGHWCIDELIIKRYVSSYRDVEFSPGVGFVGLVLQSRDPIWATNIASDSRMLMSGQAREAGVKGTFVFPVVAQGCVIGVLAFSTRQVREPDERLLRAVHVIGSQIGQFLQREQAEQALRASESRFRSLTELSSDWYWEQDEHLRLTAFSNEVATRSGNTAEEAVGKTQREVGFVGVSDEGWAAHEADLAARRSFRDFETVRRSEDGTSRWLSISGEPVFDAAGVFKGYRGIGKDITARKQAESALSESETRFRQTFELAATGIAHVGLDKRFLRVNRALCEALGYSEKELVGRSVKELSHPADRNAMDEAIVRLREREIESLRADKRYLHKDGSVVWMNLAVAIVRSAEGEPQYEVVIFEDISARKETDAALRESEARFRSLTELSSDWYWEQDEEFRFTKLQSPLHAELLKTQLGKRRWEGPGVVASDPAWRSHIEKLERHQRFRDFEYSYTRPEGGRVFVRASGYPVYDAQGKFKGYCGLARDVTKQRRDKDELHRFRTALDASADMVFLMEDMRDPRILDFNETACHYLGYEREELLGQPTEMILSGVSAESLRSSHDELLRRAERSDMLVRTYLRKNGTTFEAEVLRRVVDSPDGPIIVINARDLTERRRGEERQAAHLRYQEAIARFGQLALGKREAVELMQDAAQTIQEALLAGAVAYIEPGPAAGEVVLRGLAGLQGGAHGVSTVAAYGSGHAAAIALEHGKTAIVEHTEPALAPLPFDWAAQFSCTAVVPVHGDDGIRGALCALSANPAAFGPEESKFLVAAASVLSAGLGRIESEGRLAFLAQFDVLTGLPNRALLSDRFSQLIVQARRHGTPLGVLFIDLDDFKMVNDSLGHAGGDELLKEAAQRLQSAVRPGDTVARISGDEFAVILSDLARPDDAALVAQKIIDRLATPMQVRGHEVFVTASIGIAAFPADGGDAEGLLGAADAAMYRAKQSGRNGYQFFTAEINQRTRARAQLGSELRRALEREEFALVYQPKYDLQTGRPCAVEALLRWNHPERGVVSPAEFIPVLEETGLIVAVGEWVLQRACKDLKSWQAEGAVVVPIAVNLSARQFRLQDLDLRLIGLLKAAGVEPKLIELEITESQLMQDPDQAIRIMRSLSSAGIRIAIDDFGTGYSSLSYLTRFPVAALKIDRSFVADVLIDKADAAIVRTIIDMAHTLGSIVIAEGVETEAQAALLRSLGCEQAQGYFFARPMPEADLKALLSSYAKRPPRKARAASRAK